MLRHCPTPPCHFERSEAEPRNLRPSSFLSLCSTTAPCRMGNYPPIVSCRYAPPLPHAAQETIREQFPAAMLLHCFMPDGKLSANSFLPPCSTTAPCRTRNYPPIVSCRHAPPLSHAEWETIKKDCEEMMTIFSQSFLFHKAESITADSFLHWHSYSGPGGKEPSFSYGCS